MYEFFYLYNVYTNFYATHMLLQIYDYNRDFDTNGASLRLYLNLIVIVGSI